MLNGAQHTSEQATRVPMQCPDEQHAGQLWCKALPSAPATICCMPRRWPFAAAQQAVFIDSIVALNLSGVTSDKVKFISAILIGRRRLLAEEHQRHLLQAQVANNGQSVDVKFQIQAQDVAATSIVASQLYTATTAGTLTVRSTCSPSCHYASFQVQPPSAHRDPDRTMQVIMGSTSNATAFLCAHICCHLYWNQLVRCLLDCLIASPFNSAPQHVGKCIQAYS